MTAAPKPADTASPTDDVSSFPSLDPATGEVVATFAVRTKDEVNEAVRRAKVAANYWAGLGEPARRSRLTAWRSRLVKDIEELAALIQVENGKPLDDAVTEVSIAVAHLDWATQHARKVLGRRRVMPGVLAPNHTASVEYLPFGVVGVIGPWNYPVHTPMGSISYALAAGNAVVFKPSEFTSAVGTWLGDSFAEVVPEQPVFQIVTGFAATGAALCTAGVDKLAFTGSARTGKRVMASCAETLTPCVIEGGGKDAMIVAADADVELAAAQAVWGAMFNGGQTCAGVERVYVEAPIYQDFLARVRVHAAKLTVGESAGSDYGAITMPGQVDIIAAHIDDALARGGRALVGGRESVRAPFIEPVVLVEVPRDSTAVTQETFGPTMVIDRVADLDEAVEQANSGAYGLGASVFSRQRGDDIAGRLKAGMVSINSVLTYASVPGLPWGGSGNSGFGRIHGADGLREFARSRAVTRQRFPIPLKLTTFERNDKAIDQLKRIVRLRWGRSVSR